MSSQQTLARPQHDLEELALAAPARACPMAQSLAFQQLKSDEDVPVVQDTHIVDGNDVGVRKLALLMNHRKYS